MSRLPPPPSTPTIPAPKDEDPMRLMREVRAALENTGELMTRLSTKLACIELAMLADEHKTNTLREDLEAERAERGKLSERVAALEVQAAE